MSDEFDREDSQDVVDWLYFEKSRAELGPGFIRILGYYREDGEKSVAKIEQAMHEHDTVALVIPAHTLRANRASSGPSHSPPSPKRSRMSRASASRPTAFPTNWCPTWWSFAGCSIRRWPVRQGYQSPEDPRRAGPASDAR